MARMLAKNISQEVCTQDEHERKTNRTLRSMFDPSLKSLIVYYGSNMASQAWRVGMGLYNHVHVEIATASAVDSTEIHNRNTTKTNTGNESSNDDASVLLY